VRTKCFAHQIAIEAIEAAAVVAASIIIIKYVLT